MIRSQFPIRVSSLARATIRLRRSPDGDYEPITPSGVGQLFHVLGRKVGVRAYPHLLRHSFATFALQQGMNPITLAQILGHESLVMIQRVYSHLSPMDTYEALLKALTLRD